MDYNTTNKLIAEFMGKLGDEYASKNINSRMFYHSSWNSLMPVVEKIESLVDDYHGRFGVHIIGNTCTIQATNFRPDERIPDRPYYFNSHTTDTKIYSTYLAVSEFVKWRNKSMSVYLTDGDINMYNFYNLKRNPVDTDWIKGYDRT